MCDDCDHDEDTYSLNALNGLPVVPGDSDACGPDAPAGDCAPTPVTPVPLTPGDDPCETDWLVRAGLGFGAGGTASGPYVPPPPPPPPPPPAPIYRSVAVEGNFIRNNCGPGQLGNSYTVRIAAGAFTSRLSQADADRQARVWLSLTGQLTANQKGDCRDDPADNPVFSDLMWSGESGCLPGTSFSNVGWGWASGAVDTGCPAAEPKFSELGWNAVEGCPEPITRLFGAEWGIISCN